MGDKDKGLLSKLKAADTETNTATSDASNVPRATIGAGLLGKLKASDSSTPDQTVTSVVPEQTEKPPAIQSMQAISGQGDHVAMNDDLKFASDVMGKLMGSSSPFNAPLDRNHNVTISGKTGQGNLAIDVFKGTGDYVRTIPNKRVSSDLSPIVKDATLTTVKPSGIVTEPLTNPTTANVEAARKTIQSEVSANSTYLNDFVTKNSDELLKYPSLTGNYTGMDKSQIDPAGIVKKITNPTGDKQALADFTTSSLSLLDEKHKQEIANIENAFPLKYQVVNAGADNDRTYREDQAGYDSAIASANKNYNDQKTNLTGAVTNLAQLKVANEYVNRKGPSAAVTDKDYLQIGLDVAEAMDAPGIDKIKNYATAGRLSDAEKVYYERIGGNALRYKTMEAAGNGQEAIASALHKSNDNYERKIYDANPAFRKEQVVNAISDAIYKKTEGASNPTVTPETIAEIGAELKLNPKDYADVVPTDIKREPNSLQSWLAGLNESGAHLYEFGMRHMFAPAFNHFGAADLRGKEITDEDLDKVYPHSWWDNRGMGGTILTGGPKPNASTMFGQANSVNTDSASADYLQNIANPEAGKLQPYMSEFLHSSANLLGNLSGFAMGSGAIGKAAKGLNLLTDVQKAEKAGTAAMVVLQNYDENMKLAREAVPGDKPDEKGKQLTMGLLYTGLDIAAIEMFSPLDMKNKIFGGDNPIGNEILQILKKEGPEGLQYNNTGARLLTKALKSSGVDWAKLTGGMTAAEAGKKIVDFAIAPDKYKNENPAEEISQVAVQNAIMNIIPSVAAGIGSAKQQGDLKGMLPFEVGSNPRQYLDGIDQMVKLGKMDEATAEGKRNTVNVLSDIVANTPVESLTTSNPLSPDQRSQYANSLFNEEIANQQKLKSKDKVLQGQLDTYIKAEQKKRGEIMDAVDKPLEVPAEQKPGSNTNNKNGNNEEVSAEKTGNDQESGLPQERNGDENGLKKVLTDNSSTTDGGGTAPVISEIPEQNNVTINDMLDKQIMFKGKKAYLYKDAEGTVLASIHDGPEWEIGKADQVSDHLISEYGIQAQPESIVKIKDDGKFDVRGKEYENRYSDPLKAINYAPDGERVSVTLHTPEGKPRTFKGDVAEDIAYQIHLKEIAKNNETAELERFINETPDVRDEIAAAKSDNTSEPGPASTTGESTIESGGPKSFAANEPVEHPTQVPRKKIERKEKVEVPELFHHVDPAFDFEAEPNHKVEVVTPAASEQVPENNPGIATNIPDNQPVVNNQPLPVEEQAKKAATFFEAPRSEQETTESAKVGDNIKQKFNQAEKIVGNKTARILEDGTKIPGHFVMIDAFGPTPSNDPNSMKMSEGFPTLEDGRNPNDRDYTQSSNEGNVRKRANDYDGRALQNIPTVDKNGVVIDGNDRTMSGQLAAATGKDGKYYQTLKEKAADYGFTAEQVVDMKARNKNPRVVFVPDVIAPYNTETFAKFNPRTVGKVKTAIEDAIQFGRTAPQKLIDALGRQMNGYDKVSEFFADKNAVKNTIDLLEAHGIINSDSKNAYYNVKERTFTPEGKELLQNMMLGKSFNEDTLRLLQNHADIREKMLFAMNNILAIEAKGPEYSLKQHISDALHLWDKVENYRENVAQLPATEEGREKAYEQYQAQLSLFEDNISPEAEIIWDDMNSRKKSSLRELTKSYLHAANEHGNGADMFGNLPPQREELLKQYFTNKEHERQLLDAARKATGDRVERSTVDEIQQTQEQRVAGNEIPPQTSTGATAIEGAEPGETSGLSLFEPSVTYSKAESAVPQTVETTEAISAEPSQNRDINELLKLKPSELSTEEKHTVYEHQKAQYEKYSDLIKTKQERVTDLRDQLEALDKVNKQDTEEYKELKRKLIGNETTLNNAKQQKALAADTIYKYEGKRAGDALREWAKTNLGDNLVYSSPFAFVKPTVKALLDLVAKGLDAGWNIRHAIRRALAEHKAADPAFKKLMEEHPDNENITSNWLHTETIGKVNDKHGEGSVKPDLGSAKNKQLADAIISKIKNDELTLEEAADKIYEHPTLPDETKLKLIDYIEHYTGNEETLVRDRNNANFLDDYKSQASNELKNFSSGHTIEDVFGEGPAGDQSYVTDKLGLMLNDAEKMISLAQFHWGDKITDYGPRLLDYVNKMSRDEGPKKGSLLATYLGKLHEAKLRGEGDTGTMNNLLDHAEQSWQRYINQVGKELNTGRLLRLFRDKNLSEFYADRILSEKQQKAKDALQNALRNEKISDEVADEGIFRDQSEVKSEETQRSAERTQEETAKKKDTKETAKGKGDESFKEKAAKKLKEIKDPTELLNNIIEKIKKTPC